MNKVIVAVSRSIGEAIKECLNSIINAFRTIADKAVNIAISKEKMYEKDADFKRYVDRYCQSRGLTVKEALRHDLVKEVAKYYRDE